MIFRRHHGDTTLPNLNDPVFTVTMTLDLEGWVRTDGKWVQIVSVRNVGGLLPYYILTWDLEGLKLSLACLFPISNM